MREGGCLCGTVRYEIEGEAREAAHCHCRMCQKASGAAFLTWVTFPASAFHYTQGIPASYRSSGRASREFCGTCGCQLVFRADGNDGVDVTLASLDHPDEFQPVANIWTSSRRAFVHGFDTRLDDIEGDWPD